MDELAKFKEDNSGITSTPTVDEIKSQDVESDRSSTQDSESDKNTSEDASEEKTDESDDDDEVGEGAVVRASIGGFEKPSTYVPLDSRRHVRPATSTVEDHLKLIMNYFKSNKIPLLEKGRTQRDLMKRATEDQKSRSDVAAAARTIEELPSSSENSSPTSESPVKRPRLGEVDSTKLLEIRKRLIGPSQTNKTVKPIIPENNATQGKYQNLEKFAKPVRPLTAMKPTTTASAPVVPVISPLMLKQKLEKMQKTRKAVRDLFVDSIKLGTEYHHVTIPETTSIENYAKEIEEALFQRCSNANASELTPEYKSTCRSLAFNLNDNKNPDLLKDVVSGVILPDRLVRLNPEEMANNALKEWRAKRDKEFAGSVVLEEHQAAAIAKKSALAGETQRVNDIVAMDNDILAEVDSESSESSSEAEIDVRGVKRDKGSNSSFSQSAEFDDSSSHEENELVYSKDRLSLALGSSITSPKSSSTSLNKSKTTSRPSRTDTVASDDQMISVAPISIDDDEDDGGLLHRPIRFEIEDNTPEISSPPTSLLPRSMQVEEPEAEAYTYTSSDQPLSLFAAADLVWEGPVNFGVGHSCACKSYLMKGRIPPFGSFASRRGDKLLFNGSLESYKIARYLLDLASSRSRQCAIVTLEPDPRPVNVQRYLQICESLRKRDRAGYISEIGRNDVLTDVFLLALNIEDEFYSEMLTLTAEPKLVVVAVWSRH